MSIKRYEKLFKIYDSDIEGKITWVSMPGKQ